MKRRHAEQSVSVKKCACVCACLVGNVLVFIKEHFELADADAQVSIRELVRNVETQWTEFPALDDVSVEQTERQQERPKLSGLREKKKKKK